MTLVGVAIQDMGSIALAVKILWSVVQVREHERLLI